MRSTLLLLLAVFTISACSVKPKGNYQQPTEQVFTDYSKAENWAALPTKRDPADLVPNKTFEENQAAAEADVFFLHPTTYTGAKRNQTKWYAPLDDEVTNEKTDETTIKYQASIFNGTGKIYAPRYRQMHLHGFYTQDAAEKKEGAKAYQLAYQDIKAAFDYYLKNYNQGRPIIIAAHSQGTGHGIQLLKDFFDGKPLQKQLVVAYLVGWPVEKDDFKGIPVCETPSQNNCFCTWRSFQKGHYPERGYQKDNETLVTNPLTWTTSKEYAAKSLNEGAVLRKFEKVFPQIADAQIEKGILWVTKPKFPGSFLWRTKNYHVADLNLFWVDVRENVANRVAAFLEN